MTWSKSHTLTEKARDDCGIDEPPRLIHLNGAPGVGKSTIAARWQLDHPSALVVEIDQLRVQLAGWQSDEDSKLLARELAVGLIDAHLQTGNDVIVPQFLGRLSFIERLEQIAATRGARFVEVMLTAEPGTISDRFVTRNTVQTSDEHPANTIPDAQAPELATESLELLRSIVRARPGIVVLDAMCPVDEVVDVLFSAMGVDR